MKAKVRETGEKIEVEHQNLGDKGSDIAFYCDGKGSFSMYELDFDIYNQDSSINWECRRYEIAKELLAARKIELNNLLECHEEMARRKRNISLCVEYADLLIETLKGGEQ